MADGANEEVQLVAEPQRLRARGGKPTTWHLDPRRPRLTRAAAGVDAVIGPPYEHVELAAYLHCGRLGRRQSTQRVPRAPAAEKGPLHLIDPVIGPADHEVHAGARGCRFRARKRQAGGRKQDPWAEKPSRDGRRSGVQRIVTLTGLPRVRETVSIRILSYLVGPSCLGDRIDQLLGETALAALAVVGRGGDVVDPALFEALQGERGPVAHARVPVVLPGRAAPVDLVARHRRSGAGSPADRHPGGLATSRKKPLSKAQGDKEGEKACGKNGARLF